MIISSFYSNISRESWIRAQNRLISLIWHSFTKTQILSERHAWEFSSVTHLWILFPQYVRLSRPCFRGHFRQKITTIFYVKYLLLFFKNTLNTKRCLPRRKAPRQTSFRIYFVFERAREVVTPCFWLFLKRLPILMCTPCPSSPFPLVVRSPSEISFAFLVICNLNL